jgi:hypothetical protein
MDEKTEITGKFRFDQIQNAKTVFRLKPTLAYLMGYSE